MSLASVRVCGGLQHTHQRREPVVQHSIMYRHECTGGQAACTAVADIVQLSQKQSRSSTSVRSSREEADYILLRLLALEHTMSARDMAHLVHHHFGKFAHAEHAGPC